MPGPQKKKPPSQHNRQDQIYPRRDWPYNLASEIDWAQVSASGLKEYILRDALGVGGFFDPSKQYSPVRLIARAAGSLIDGAQKYKELIRKRINSPNSSKSAPSHSLLQQLAFLLLLRCWALGLVAPTSLVRLLQILLNSDRTTKRKALGNEIPASKRVQEETYWAIVHFYAHEKGSCLPLSTVARKLKLGATTVRNAKKRKSFGVDVEMMRGRLPDSERLNSLGKIVARTGVGVWLDENSSLEPTINRKTVEVYTVTKAGARVVRAKVLTRKLK